jgi:hypothetical protein
LSVFCSFNVSIDEGMFGLSIGASKIGLGEFTESNGRIIQLMYRTIMYWLNIHH